MRKPAFCICENKGADQLRLKPCKLISAFVFTVHYIDSTISLLSDPKLQASTHFMIVQLDLFRTWSEIPKTGFVKMCYLIN